MSDELKLMTRKEYYTSKGFSGSELNRPDDLVDTDFIKHVNGLDNIMNTLIENSKKQSPRRITTYFTHTRLLDLVDVPLKFLKRKTFL